MKRRGFIAAALALIPGAAVLKLKPPLNGLQRDLLSSRGEKRTAAVEDFEQAITGPLYGRGPAAVAWEERQELNRRREMPSDWVDDMIKSFASPEGEKMEELIVAAFDADNKIS